MLCGDVKRVCLVPRPGKSRAASPTHIPLPTFVWLALFQEWSAIYTGFFMGLTCELPLWTLPFLLSFWNLLWSLALVSMLSASLTPPAPVPEEYLLPEGTWTFGQLREYAFDRPELNFNFICHPIRSIWYPSFCKECGVFKPLRAHHCSVCRRCVARMDHHCPVLGSCVHAHNHKFFLQFLFWAFLVALLGALSLAPATIQIGIHFKTRPNDPEMNGFFLLPKIIVFLGLLQGINLAPLLLVFQAFLWLNLTQNLTGIEAMTKDTSFHLGSRRANVESIFGRFGWRWWLPVPSTPGNGFHFVCAQESTSSEERSERSLTMTV